MYVTKGDEEKKEKKRSFFLRTWKFKQESSYEIF